MTHKQTFWLDAERDSGEVDVSFEWGTPPRRDRVAGDIALSSQRDFVVEGVVLLCPAKLDGQGTLHVVRGLMDVCTVSLHELRYARWPLRVQVPARQNLCLAVCFPEQPLELRLFWRRLRGEAEQLQSQQTGGEYSRRT